MLLFRFEDGTTDFWSVGEPKPTIDPLDIVFIHATGDELELVNNTAPQGLKTPEGAVGGKWLGDLAGTVWVNF
jgi:hypothetical protein